MIAPLGSPEHQPLPDFVVDVEQLQVAAELAVVALLRLLEHG